MLIVSSISKIETPQSFRYAPRMQLHDLACYCTTSHATARTSHAIARTSMLLHAPRMQLHDLACSRNDFIQNPKSPTISYKIPNPQRFHTKSQIPNDLIQIFKLVDLKMSKNVQKDEKLEIKCHKCPKVEHFENQTTPILIRYDLGPKK